MVFFFNTDREYINGETYDYCDFSLEECVRYCAYQCTLEEYQDAFRWIGMEKSPNNCWLDEHGNKYNDYHTPEQYDKFLRIKDRIFNNDYIRVVSTSDKKFNLKDLVVIMLGIMCNEPASLEDSDFVDKFTNQLAKKVGSSEDLEIIKYNFNVLAIDCIKGCFNNKNYSRECVEWFNAMKTFDGKSKSMEQIIPTVNYVDYGDLCAKDIKMVFDKSESNELHLFIDIVVNFDVSEDNEHLLQLIDKCGIKFDYTFNNEGYYRAWVYTPQELLDVIEKLEKIDNAIKLMLN